MSRFARAHLPALFTVIAATAAHADVEPLRPVESFTINGGLVAGASCIGAHAAQGPTGATITLAGVPPGAQIFRAYLWYIVLHTDAGVPAGSPTVNGMPLAPVPLGVVNRSPCFAQSHTGAFRADVTSIVTGDGDYTLDGFPSSGTGITGTYTEGATIAVVYCDPSAPARDILIYDGVDVVDGVVTQHSQTLSGLTATGTGASWLAVVGNGQPTAMGEVDRLSLNGTELETFVPTLDVLGGRACPPRFDEPLRNGYWDLGFYDVTALVPAAASSAAVRLLSLPDCYSVTAYALAADTGATPEPCSAAPCTQVPGVVGHLYLVKIPGNSASAEWDLEPVSTGGYHLYRVVTKDQIPTAPSVGTRVCDTAGGVTSCQLTPISGAPEVRFYQVVGVCEDGRTEGPVEGPR